MQQAEDKTAANIKCFTPTVIRWCVSNSVMLSDDLVCLPGPDDDIEILISSPNECINVFC